MDNTKLVKLKIDDAMDLSHADVFIKEEDASHILPRKESVEHSEQKLSPEGYNNDHAFYITNNQLVTLFGTEKVEYIEKGDLLHEC